MLFAGTVSSHAWYMLASTDHRVGVRGASFPSDLPLSSNSSTDFTLMRDASAAVIESCIEVCSQRRRARAPAPPPPMESALSADFAFGAVAGAVPPQSSASVTAVSSIRAVAGVTGFEGGGVAHLGPTAGAGGRAGASCSALAFVHPARTATENNSPRIFMKDPT